MITNRNMFRNFHGYDIGVVIWDLVLQRQAYNIHRFGTEQGGKSINTFTQNLTKMDKKSELKIHIYP